MGATSRRGRPGSPAGETGITACGGRAGAAAAAAPFAVTGSVVCPRLNSEIGGSGGSVYNSDASRESTPKASL